jgi:tetratricopeptide (TPR) repeat protein
MNFVAALLLPFAFQAAQPGTAPDRETRFSQCVAQIDADPVEAYESGMAWSALTNELGGFRCAAMALVAQNRNEEGARRFESLAMGLPSESAALRAELFSQAGNAWLLARDAANARSAFTRSIATMQGDREVMPDLLIDRARAYAMEEDWRHAEEDLSNALDIRADDPLALRLRAYARMNQNAFDLAEADAQAAVALEPTNVDSLLMLGHAREAKRTGAPVEY